MNLRKTNLKRESSNGVKASATDRKPDQHPEGERQLRLDFANDKRGRTVESQFGRFSGKIPEEEISDVVVGQQTHKAQKEKTVEGVRNAGGGP